MTPDRKRNITVAGRAGLALFLGCALLLAGCSPRAPAASPSAGVNVSSGGELPGQRAAPQQAHPSPRPEPAPEEAVPAGGQAAAFPAPAAEGEAPSPIPPQPEAPPPQLEPPAETGDASPLTLEVAARIRDCSWREGETPVALEDLRYLTPRYVGFDGLTYTGELIVHKSLAAELADIFEELYAAGFPLSGMRLIDDFGGDDNASMAAGNTSCFNTRPIAGTSRYSMHSYGAAVDINPLQNPYVLGGRALPEASAPYLDRADIRPGMITAGSAVHTAFTSRGWVWGGDWPGPDYQHFEKAVKE